MPKLTKRRVSEAQDLEESYRLADIVKQRQKTLAALKLAEGAALCRGPNLCHNAPPYRLDSSEWFLESNTHSEG